MMRRAHVATALLCLLLSATGCGEPDWGSPTPPPPERVIAEAIASSDPWIRAESLRLLAIADLRQHTPVLHAALNDPEPMVRFAALEALLPSGDENATREALSRLVGDDPDRRIALFRTIMDHGTERARRDAVQRVLRDPDVRVRASALAELRGTPLEMPADSLLRVVEQDTPDLADAAFVELAARNPDRANDWLLRELRANDRPRRLRAIQLARHVRNANLWPALRSFAANGDADTRTAALIALGYLGDPFAEESLRTTVRTAPDPETAARAMRSLASIPTEKARAQALVHRADPRLPIRRAAFAAMKDGDFPVAAFKPFLQDADGALAAEALLYLQNRDPEYASSAFIESLNASTEPVKVMRALFRAAAGQDIGRFIVITRPRLLTLADSRDDQVAAMAARLLLLGEPASALRERLARPERPGPYYAWLEGTLREKPQRHRTIEAGLHHELLLVRVAAAAALTRTGS